MVMRTASRSILSAAAGLALLAPAAHADFSYFFVFGSSETDFTTLGSTTFDASSGEYLLTSGGGQGAGLWHNTKQNAANGFVSLVRFSILDPISGPYIPGDGLALVLTGAPDQPTIAEGGSNLGYSSIPRAIAFELDTFSFGPPGEFPAPHVSIQTGGPIEDVNSSDDQSIAHAVLSTLPDPVNVLDQAQHVLVVQYAPSPDGPGLLQMWLDERLVLSANFDMTEIADGAGEVWVGLTAGTGLANSQHRIRMFTFSGDTGACQSPVAFTAYTGSGSGGPSGPFSLFSGASVQGSRPLTYTWTRDGVPITDNQGGRIVGLETSDLAIFNATSDDHAFYALNFSNACGSASFGPVFLANAGQCNSLDFNNDGDFPTPQDLEDYIAALGGASIDGSDPLDFNNDGDFPTPLDLEVFIRVLAGGSCN